MGTILIYGANGYTGRLVAEEAVRRGLKPVLAGRRVTAVQPLATRLDLPFRIFGLDDVTAVASELADIAVVIHCAGPFSATSAPMLDACLRSGTHYLDITGEIGVFEAVFARTSELASAGVVAIPGVGFDVVPTDCMGAMLHEALPEATSLELGFLGLGGVSQGTAKTAVEGLGSSGAVRRGGRIVPSPVAAEVREVTLAGKPRTLASIPWGDVSTAYHSTGIPDITTFMALPAAQIPWMRRSETLGWLLKLKPLQALLKKVVEAQVSGPDAHARETGSSHIWGKATAADGRWVEGTLSTPEGYRLTALSAVEAAVRVLEGSLEGGAYTPSKAFGSDYITSFDGVTLHAIEHGTA